MGWIKLLPICAEYSKLDRSKCKYNFYTDSNCDGSGYTPGAATDAGMQVASNIINGKEWNDIDYGSVALGYGIGAVTDPVLGKAAKLCVGKCQVKNFFKGTRYTEKVKNRLHQEIVIVALRLLIVFQDIVKYQKLKVMME